MKYLGVAGVLLGLSLLGVPALADEAKQPVPRVGQVVIESMGPASGTIPKGKLATIVNYIHADKHTWYKNGSRHTAKYPFNKGTQRNLHDRFVLKMRYGLGDGYDVRFATPIVMNNFRAHSTLTPNSVSSKNGIGDTTFCPAQAVFEPAGRFPRRHGVGPRRLDAHGRHVRRRRGHRRLGRDGGPRRGARL